MGTRGLFGFYRKGKYYLVYNHFDSYRSGLGRDLVNEIKIAIADKRLNEWKTAVSNLKIVDPDTPPTEEDVKRLTSFANLAVSSRSTVDWYCLLRNVRAALNVFQKVVIPLALVILRQTSQVITILSRLR